jgi:hypothetical protein
MKNGFVGGLSLNKEMGLILFHAILESQQTLLQSMTNLLCDAPVAERERGFLLSLDSAETFSAAGSSVPDMKGDAR